MKPQDTEPIDLLVLIRRGWKLPLAFGIAGAAIVFCHSYFLKPKLFSATATLVIADSMLLEEDGGHQVEAYQALLESDAVMQKTAQRLVSRGIHDAETPVNLAGRLRSEILVSGRGRAARAARVLIAKATSEDPQEAADIANTWAEIFIEESEALGPGGSPAAETLLDEHLLPARSRLEELDIKRLETIELYEKRKEESISRWVGRMQALREKTDTEISKFRATTRTLMDGAVYRHRADAVGTATGAWSQSLLRKALELAAVRAQLAQSSQALALVARSQGPSIADTVIAGLGEQPVDANFLGLDINPLNDQLTLKAIEIEDQLKTLGEARLDEITKMIAELERIQFQREAELTSFLGKMQLKLDGLKRQRNLESEELERQRLNAVAALQRQIGQLADLEERLASKHTVSVVEQVLGALETVQVAARAVPSTRPEPRRIPLNTSLGLILGGLLGLLVALFR